MKIIISFVLVLFSALSFGSIESTTFQDKPIHLGEKQVRFINADGMTEIDELLSRELLKTNKWEIPKSLNFGYGPEPKWFRVEIKNSHDAFTVKYLYPMMQTVKMYLVQDGKIVEHKLGGKKFKNDVYRGVLIESRSLGPQTVFFFLESSGPYQVPISIGTHDMIQEQVTVEYLALGTWLGLIAALMIYYFIIYLKLHDSMYLYFTLYGVPLVLINLSFSGIFYQYFPDFLPFLKSRLVIVSIGLMLVFLTLFTKHFFEIFKNSGLPKLVTRTIDACIIIPLTLSIINLISYTTFTISLTGLLGIIVPLLLIAVAFYMLIKGRNGTYLYIVATGSFLAGFIVYCLKDFAILPHTHFTSYSIFYTSSLEMMLLAFAIANKFRDIQFKNESLIKTVILKEKSAELATVAHQLAHDIRSPLEVLKSLKHEVSSLPESSRRRIALSINRIEEITFNLLKNHRENHAQSTLNNEDLLTLLSSVLAEKEIEYRQNDKIQIDGIFDSSSYGLFPKINRTDLKNIISNLLNNSIQAIGGSSGIVSIGLTQENNRHIIRISDNGAGIPNNVRDGIFSKGFTTKSIGNGLGLFRAKQDIEAVGGTIGFESELGKGTTFTISLPKSKAPATFIGSIDAYKYERIIVLDDDPAFHEVWAKRLEGLESKVEHIHSVEEMLSKYQALHPKILLLSDFELMDKQMDGIDTILKLGHSEHSVLVTARNEEKAIQDRCLAAGIKLVPKSLVNYVTVRMTGMPMVINRRFGMQAKAGAERLPTGSEGIGDGSSIAQIGSNLIVLIDDDRLVHLNWKSHCKKNG